MPPMSQTEREAIEAGTVWWDGELFSGRPDWPRLLETPYARLSAGRAAFPRPRRPGALRDGDRLGDDQRLPRPAPARLAVHQGPRLSRDEHREGVRRAGLLRLRALPGHDQAVHAFGHGGRDRDGAELARARRAARALRDRRAEAPLPAAPGQGARNPLFRADESECRLRRGVDPRLRHRLLGRARGPARAGTLRHLGQALHHARPRRDAARARVPRLRSRAPRRRPRGPRHHLRADPDVATRRGDRPPPHAAQCGVPERPHLGQGRLRPDGLGDRRAADAGPRLADADGVPRRGSRHLAAVVGHRHGQARGARGRRLCARAPAVQDADRQVRGHRGSADAHGRQPLPDGRRAHAHRGGDRSRREAGGDLRHREAAPHRTRPPGRQRRHGRHRRQGHLHGPVELHRRGVHADPRRDHRRGREHPDPQPDRLRAGRDPLPSATC